MQVLAGKKALLTGAASGIGLALARALAREGVDVYLVDIDETRLGEAVAEIRSLGVRAVGRRCDLSQSDQVHALVQDLLADWGEIDILINNAGIAYYGATHRMTEAQWDRLLSVNLLAPIQLTRELLPTLLDHDESHLVNIASIGGLVAVSKGTAYQVSKFAIQGFSESLRAEYGKFRLGVTSVCPGFVRTELFERATNDEGTTGIRTPPRWATTSPERVAELTIRAIRRNSPIVVITLPARIAWYLKRLAPSLFLRLSGLRLRRRRWQPPEKVSLETKNAA